MSRLAGRLLVLGGLLLAAAPVRAEAHAVLLAADPPQGLLLASPPAEISLTFSEPVTPVGSGIELISPSGARVPGTLAQAGGNRLSLGVRLTGQGTYRVVWKVVSADTHPSRGTFTFSVGAVSAAPGSEVTRDVALASPGGLVLQVGGRWLGFAGLALLAGAIWTWLLLFPAEARLSSLAGIGIGAVVAGAAISVAGEAASLGGLDGASMVDVLGSPFGRVIALKLGAALLAWTLLGAVAESDRWRPALLAPPVALALVEGASGHLLAGLPAPAAWLLNGIHVGAMAAWMGGLATVLALRLPVARLAQPAAGLAALAIGSGLVLAAFHLRSPADLLLTAYGAILALKIVAVAAVLALAAFAARRLELAALGGVVALAALIGSLPQPR